MAPQWARLQVTELIMNFVHGIEIPLEVDYPKSAEDSTQKNEL